MIEQVTEIVGPVYMVGGAVRDIILGKEPVDYDFATPLLPDEIEAKIREKGKRPFITGKRFGTIGVVIDKKLVEITTFRGERYIEGSRKPIVEFVSDLSQDLARRDFTFNALACRDDKIIDPFNGQMDLKNKLIRAVGIPTHRFKDDPLRMLRACRFASQLGFDIEEKTLKSINKNNYKILNVSKERWMQELDKLLMGDHVKKGLTYLFETELMKFMIPELFIQYRFNQRTQFHQFDLHEHTMLVVQNAPKDINLKWAAMLHDVAKPFIFQDKGNRYIYPLHERLGEEFVEKISRYLHWGNDRRKVVKELVLNHLNDDSPLRKYDNTSKLNDKLLPESNIKDLNTDSISI